jgi:virginiamycin A acetyltransferase
MTSYPFPAIPDEWGQAEHLKIEASITAKKPDVVIGNDVWIGYGATILSGVEIGDGAIIGAMAVVAKNVEPYSIVAGNPARLIRKRFDEETIRKLLEIRWWDWPAEKINKNLDVICSDNVSEMIRLS